MDATVRASMMPLAEELFAVLDSSLPPDRKLAGMFVEASIAVIHQRLWSEKPAPLEEDAGLIASVFMDGLKVAEKL
jgi:hypothetical protein